MAREKNSAVNPFVRELFQFNVYKRSQGRRTRQVTFVALAGAIVLGIWRMSIYAMDAGPVFRYAVPSMLLIVGLWTCYRAVNFSRFADFLIAVEAEMNKVMWPTRSELMRASAIVMLLIFSMAFVLFGYDLFWQSLWKFLGVLGG